MTLKIVSVKKQEIVKPKEEEESLAASPKAIPIASPEKAVAEPLLSKPVESDELSQKSEVAIFSAIGLIEANSVKLVDKKIIITIANQEYQGFVRPRAYKQLCEFLESHEGTTYLRVYPKTFPEPKRNFVLRGWQLLDWKKDISPQNKTDEFVIRGIWQYISQSENPVITIYRNQESLDPTGKYLPTHLPVEMIRSDYQAFQFDPNATEQAKRYFFQGLFEFDPAKKLFCLEGRYCRS